MKSINLLEDSTSKTHQEYYIPEHKRILVGPDDKISWSDRTGKYLAFVYDSSQIFFHLALPLPLHIFLTMCALFNISV